MKLNYKIAKTTGLSSETLINRILLKIDEKKYGLTSITDSSVSFDDHTGGLIWNWEYVRRLHSGKFEVFNNKSSNILVFEYCPIPLSEFIFVGTICAVITIWAIINKVYFEEIVSSVFLGQLIFKHYNLKRIASEILNEISD